MCVLVCTPLIKILLERDILLRGRVVHVKLLTGRVIVTFLDELRCFIAMDVYNCVGYGMNLLYF